jgi:hypothetical protein
MKTNLWLVAILLCGVVPVAAGQSAAATPSPDLVAVMQRLQSSLNALPARHWVASYHDSADNSNWIYTLDFAVSQVVADPNACSIVYHYTIQRDGAVIDKDETATMTLHDVRIVEVTTGVERQTKNDVAAGHLTWSVTIQPFLYNLVVHGTDKTDEWYYLFADRASEKSVANDIEQAVTLCGGNAIETGDN